MINQFSCKDITVFAEKGEKDEKQLYFTECLTL